MAENLIISGTNKVEKYETLLPQINALLIGETNLIANLANVSSALKTTFNWLWVGFYLTDSETELVLGPFQGPLACTRIKKGKGVCGTTWQEEKTFVVENVDEFPGHIACSSASKSEIVVPIFKQNQVVAVLDVDSDAIAEFNEIDKKYLEALCKNLGELF